MSFWNEVVMSVVRGECLSICGLDWTGELGTWSMNFRLSRGASNN